MKRILISFILIISIFSVSVFHDCHRVEAYVPVITETAVYYILVAALSALGLEITAEVVDGGFIDVFVDWCEERGDDIREVCNNIALNTVQKFGGSLASIAYDSLYLDYDSALTIGSLFCAYVASADQSYFDVVSTSSVIPGTVVISSLDDFYSVAISDLNLHFPDFVFSGLDKSPSYANLVYGVQYSVCYCYFNSSLKFLLVNDTYNTYSYLSGSESSGRFTFPVFPTASGADLSDLLSKDYISDYTCIGSYVVSADGVLTEEDELRSNVAGIAIADDGFVGPIPNDGTDLKDKFQDWWDDVNDGNPDGVVIPPIPVDLTGTDIGDLSPDLPDSGSDVSDGSVIDSLSDFWSLLVAKLATIINWLKSLGSLATIVALLKDLVSPFSGLLDFLLGLSGVIVDGITAAFAMPDYDFNEKFEELTGDLGLTPSFPFDSIESVEPQDIHITYFGKDICVVSFAFIRINISFIRSWLQGIVSCFLIIHCALIFRRRFANS